MRFEYFDRGFSTDDSDRAHRSIRGVLRAAHSFAAKVAGGYHGDDCVADEAGILSVTIPIPILRYLRSRGGFYSVCRVVWAKPGRVRGRRVCYGGIVLRSTPPVRIAARFCDDRDRKAHRAYRTRWAPALNRFLEVSLGILVVLPECELV